MQSTYTFTTIILFPQFQYIYRQSCRELSSASIVTGYNQRKIQQKQLSMILENLIQTFFTRWRGRREMVWWQMDGFKNSLVKHTKDNWCILSKEEESLVQLVWERQVDSESKIQLMMIVLMHLVLISWVQVAVYQPLQYHPSTCNYTPRCTSMPVMVNVISYNID